MHRTSARPPPLDFLHYSSYGIERRKDPGLVHSLRNFTSGYLEYSNRDGLRTPPSDDMETAYQQSQYSNHASQQGANYPHGGLSRNAYLETYSALSVQSRPVQSGQSQAPASSVGISGNSYASVTPERQTQLRVGSAGNSYTESPSGSNGESRSVQLSQTQAQAPTYPNMSGSSRHVEFGQSHPTIPTYTEVNRESRPEPRSVQLEQSHNYTPTYSRVNPESESRPIQFGQGQPSSSSIQASQASSSNIRSEIQPTSLPTQYSTSLYSVDNIERPELRPVQAGRSETPTYSGANAQARPVQRGQNQASASDIRTDTRSIPPLAQYSSSQLPSPRPTGRINNIAPVDTSSRPKSGTGDMILPNLQIPSSINNSGGSLAEFAAQITCLFWFESTSILQKAEKLSPTSSPVRRLRPDAIPSSGFRKWVVTILSTTQVAQNVILLALLFIYRLKTINPTVKGKPGSEFRLLTVALMLGNKFLDDNTYTNKTWAEVSGISVTEIHVMEVEFLSNMRYSLLASEEQWKEWQGKLGKFWDYCDAAAKAPLPQPSLTAPSFQPNLPSPATSAQASPPSLSTLYPPTSASFAHGQGWNNTAPLISPSLPGLISPQPRKRSYVDDLEEPAPKRITRNPLPSLGYASNSSVRLDAPRLPVPNLTISTNQSYNPSLNLSLPQNVPQLPPISSRAMSTVYPNNPSTPTWGPQHQTLAPIGQQSQHGTYSANGNGHITPRRQSPYSGPRDILGSSPITANFSNHNSPSFYLQQRGSPYKPVRNVNTLLIPPPSGSMHSYSTNTNQMHYQPLGKRQEFRSGVAYPTQQWNLPQPNFYQ